jgi:hypothetical protein
VVLREPHAPAALRLSSVARWEAIDLAPVARGFYETARRALR